MNDTIREDEGLDLEPFLEGALKEVVSTILSYAEYPQPKRRGAGMPRQRLFDLYDYVFQYITKEDLIEFYIDQLTTNHFEADDERSAETWKLEKMLLGHLKGTKLVRARAEELAEEAKEES